MLLVFGFLVKVVRWPALVVLGLWIVIQALSGIVTFSAAAWGGGQAGARRGLPTSADLRRARPCCF